jgi:hypothetical protein
MLRTAAWTLGLFGAGSALIAFFPQPWAQPLLLLGLGVAFLWASARRPVPRTRPAARPGVELPAGLAGQAASEQA